MSVDPILAVLGLVALLLLVLIALVLRLLYSGGGERELARALEASRREILQAMAAQSNGMAQSTQNLMNFVAQSQKNAHGAVVEWTRTSDAALAGMREKLEREFRDLQTLMETKLERVRGENEAKLETIRSTVSEKLDQTLGERLSASFRTVDEKLALVERGLGEMRAMGENVRRLQNILSNVKTRGIFGETQLESILSEILAPGQWEKQVRVVPERTLAVDFAVRLPGRGGLDDAPVWLPIDSKFPMESWERLEAARETGDARSAAEAAKALERAVLKQAESIREKYVSPPHTTEFAVMFLPSEGLYAEVLRIPGLFERMQRECRVTAVGPSVTAALLNSLLMGFMTLAMERRTSEIWRLLANVKTEFEQFSAQYGVVEKKFREAQNSLAAMGTRSRAMGRTMKEIDGLSVAGRPIKPEAATLLERTPGGVETIEEGNF